ncbi:MAG: septum formation inhibitor Maf [Deltaproteobacteria bacterium]|uniref:dTTP/UTP pyrophosphatase n=1 Tax=Candidatus Zymogenus saltonus TaxID=2844893 RepID=A0A9D8KKK2_9DELT|nr:septum formation inhibitor Maf [Candidatus Zymogenus saltonus]
MTTRKIVLASNSPRRRELLSSVGIIFDVITADVDESLIGGETPSEHAERLSLEKAVKVAEIYPDAFVIGADSVVVLEGRIMGKPRDARDAKEMLQSLSGKKHSVITGYSVTAKDEGIEVSCHAETFVTMKELGIDEIAAYVATSEPMDKAGAYAVQGYASIMVREINGSYSNVVGLPVSEVVELLIKLGALKYAG